MLYLNYVYRGKAVEKLWRKAKGTKAVRYVSRLQ